MPREQLTDEQVEREIDRLKQSEYVKLAKRDQQIKYRRRQYLYTLRSLEKTGRELAESGITMEMLERMEGTTDAETEN